MTAVVIGGLRMRKLRAVLTALAIVLGVAMISGTYVLMDTTTHAFNSVFATEYSKADAVVVGKSPISGPGLSAPSVPAAVVARIRALAQVQDVQGFILDTRAQLRTAHGGAISGATVAVGGPGAHSAFYATTVIAGHRPTGPGEIAIDEQTATSNHLGIGSKVGIVSLHPLQYFRVVGIVRYGGVGSLGPIRLVGLDLPVAQRLFNKQGVYDQIYVSSRPGVSSQQLVRAIAPLLPATAQVRTRAEQVQITDQRRQLLAGDRPLRAARIRRDRAVRRIVRDLQHAVGDGRAAHPRVRDAADARRFASPGARHRS